MAVRFLDGKLPHRKRGTIGARKILVIGTASDGPLYEPVAVSNIEDAEDIFGREGTLFKGIYEAFYAFEGGRPAIEGMRIGNGKRAYLYLAEAPGSGLYAPAPSGVTESGISYIANPALILEALYPGTIYNNVSIRIGYTQDGRNAVILYNPKTGKEVSFTFDLNPDHSADVHDVKELAEAINNSEIGSVIKATYNLFDAKYEILIDDDDAGTPIYASGIVVNNNILYLTLSDRVTCGTDGILNLYTGEEKTFSVTAGNRIDTLTEVYEIGGVREQLLDIAGYNSADLTYEPVKLGSEYPIIDIEGYGNYPNDTPKSEYYFVVRQAYMGVSQSGNQTTFYLECPIPPSDSAFQSAYNSYLPDDYTWNDVYQGDTLKVYVTENGVTKTAEDWGYSYQKSWLSGSKKLKIKFSSNLPLFATVSVSFDSVIDVLTYNPSYQAVINSNDYKQYYVNGKRITFGDVLPYPIKITYRAKIPYEIEQDVIISDSYKGTIAFVNPAKQPGTWHQIAPEVIRKLADKDVPCGTGVDEYGNVVGSATYSKVPPLSDVDGNGDSIPARIGLVYKYLPEWIDLTSAKNLSGGTNGTNLTVKEKREELETVLSLLSNYDGEVFVAPGFYLDETYEEYNASMGTYETKNAGYLDMIKEFVDKMNSEGRPALWIMSVKPIEGTPTATVVKNHVSELVIEDVNDPFRAANILADFEDKFIIVTYAEPIIQGLTGSYHTTMEALLAGKIASLSLGESIYNKTIQGLYGMRYDVFDQSYIDRLKENYVTVVKNRRGNYVIVSEPTLAASTSDYKDISLIMLAVNAAEAVTSLAEPFIGQPLTNSILASYKKKVDGFFAQLITQNALRDFDIKLVVSPTAASLGEVSVEVTLVPAFVWKKINVKIALNTGAAIII